MRLRLVLSLLAILLPVAAQEYRGSILGRVTDASGAVAPGTTIKVTNVETGVSSETTTGAEGNYHVPFLLPGTYTVTADRPGFKKAQQGGVLVQAASGATVNLALEVGSNAE